MVKSNKAIYSKNGGGNSYFPSDTHEIKANIPSFHYNIPSNKLDIKSESEEGHDLSGMIRNIKKGGFSTEEDQSMVQKVINSMKNFKLGGGNKKKSIQKGGTFPNSYMSNFAPISESETTNYNNWDDTKVTPNPDINLSIDGAPIGQGNYIPTPGSDWGMAVGESIGNTQQILANQIGGKSVVDKKNKLKKKELEDSIHKISKVIHEDKKEEDKIKIKKIKTILNKLCKNMDDKKKGGYDTTAYLANISGNLIKPPGLWAESMHENVYPPNPMDSSLYAKIGAGKNKKSTKSKKSKK